MRTAFGQDFSDVRVHTDAAADESAHAVGAQAYAVGHDIVFAAGRFAPHTEDGERLLTHELGHVLEQRISGRRLARQPVHQQVAAPTQADQRDYVASVIRFLHGSAESYGMWGPVDARDPRIGPLTPGSSSTPSRACSPTGCGCATRRRP
ncbi:eCIS core domain-containing protein [Streptomyces sp. NPDC055722]